MIRTVLVCLIVSPDSGGYKKERRGILYHYKVMPLSKRPLIKCLDSSVPYNESVWIAYKGNEPFLFSYRLSPFFISMRNDSRKIDDKLEVKNLFNNI